MANIGLHGKEDGFGKRLVALLVSHILTAIVSNEKARVRDSPGTKQQLSVTRRPPRLSAEFAS